MSVNSAETWKCARIGKQEIYMIKAIRAPVRSVRNKTIADWSKTIFCVTQCRSRTNYKTHVTITVTWTWFQRSSHYCDWMRVKILKMLHQKCINGVYPSSSVTRFNVPVDKIPWNVTFSEYEPVEYTSPVVNGKVWADPDMTNEEFSPRWNCVDGENITKYKNQLFQIVQLFHSYLFNENHKFSTYDVRNCKKKYPIKCIVSIRFHLENVQILESGATV